MRAAILTELNKPLEVDNVECCDLAYGQVRVRLQASGICGAQLQEIRGEKGNAKMVPHLLGHEGCGIVEEAGPAVSRVKIGDKVVLHWRRGDGIESDFPRYIYGGRQITSGKVVTFAEEAIASENRVTPVPADTPRELCALLGCGLSTALGTIENEAALRFGESILIVGCGGLGVNLILAAKLRGAGQIAVMDVYPEKGPLAYGMGAHVFFTPDVLQDMPRRFDVIVDSAGGGFAMEQTLPWLASGGRYIMLGQPKPGQTVEMHGAKHMFDGDGKTIRATQGGQFNPTRDIPRYIALHRTGQLRLDELITHRIPLEHINHGLELVRNGQAGRVLIEMAA